MRRLALFARVPAPGRVKTRLVPALPERLAADLYSGWLADAMAAVAAAPAEERIVFWADAPGRGDAPLESRVQRGAGLGERLSAAFDELLDGSGARALIVGSDTPALTATHLAAALDALESHDIVLGPARDGGYWCVGLRKRVPELFRDVPWSTDQVLERTLEHARDARVDAGLVDTLDDLDTPADLARLVGALAAGRPA